MPDLLAQELSTDAIRPLHNFAPFVRPSAITLKTLLRQPDSSDPIRQRGVQVQVLAITDQGRSSVILSAASMLVSTFLSNRPSWCLSLVLLMALTCSQTTIESMVKPPVPDATRT